MTLVSVDLAAGRSVQTVCTCLTQDAASEVAPMHLVMCIDA